MTCCVLGKPFHLRDDRQTVARPLSQGVDLRLRPDRVSRPGRPRSRVVAWHPKAGLGAVEARPLCVNRPVRDRDRRQQRHGRRHVPSPEAGRRRRHTGHLLDGLDGQDRAGQQPARADRHFAIEDPVGAMYAVGSGWPCRVRRRQELDSQGRRPAQSSTTERYARLHSVIFGVTRGARRCHPSRVDVRDPRRAARATVVRQSGRPAIWAGQQ